MKTNKGAIILTERAANDGRLRAVLREWGYGENEIHRFLKEQRVDQKPDLRSERSDQPTAESVA